MNARELRTTLQAMVNGAEGLLFGANQLAGVLEGFIQDAERGHLPSAEQLALYRNECAEFRTAIGPMQAAIDATQRKLSRRGASH